MQKINIIYLYWDLFIICFHCPAASLHFNPTISTRTEVVTAIDLESTSLVANTITCYSSTTVHIGCMVIGIIIAIVFSHYTSLDSIAIIFASIITIILL